MALLFLKYKTNTIKNKLMAHDANGQALAEGDRVKTMDFGGWVSGTLHKNTQYPHVSEWYVAYDDGGENAVLSLNHIWKAEEK